jgi:hypothetical protein
VVLSLQSELRAAQEAYGVALGITAPRTSPAVVSLIEPARGPAHRARRLRPAARGSGPATEAAPGPELEDDAVTPKTPVPTVDDPETADLAAVA